MRVHSRITTKGNFWARLWYFLRAIDQEGSGWIEISLEELSFCLDAKTSTIYEWLRAGLAAKAFRWWQCRRGNLKVALGGLYAISKAQGWKANEENPDWAKGDRRKTKKIGVPPWGATAEVRLYQIILSSTDLKAVGTASTAQRLQQLSRYAAWRNLPKNVRHYKDVSGKQCSLHLPQPSEFFNSEDNRLSHDSSGGSTRFVLKIGERWVSVSKGFIPFGASQPAIARERGYCNRTISRHLDRAGIDRKQVIQCKAAYGHIRAAISHDAPSVAPEEDIYLEWRREGYYLTEPTGRKGNPYRYPVSSDRFFRHGDREYIYRCNLYAPVLHLCRQTALRKGYAKYQANVLQSDRAGGVLQSVVSIDNKGFSEGRYWD